MSRADRETRQLLFLFTNQSANTMDSTHDDEAMRDAAMRRCADVCVDSGRTTQLVEWNLAVALVHSHMRAVCLQSLSSDRELQEGKGNGKWKSRRPLAAYRALSRQARERGGREASARLKCRVIKCRKREREMTGCQGLKS